MAVNLEDRRAIYTELCNSYRSIDNFRATLLGFLPLASGGLFVLTEKMESSDSALFIPIGIFGFFITLGLFIFEIYGIRKCTKLIVRGKALEVDMGVDGQFMLRPDGLSGLGLKFLPDRYGKYFNEPLAAGVIYPAVAAAWIYLGLYKCCLIWAEGSAVFIFLLGFVATYIFNKRLGEKEQQKAV
jgi:hypothetical protein